MTAVGIAVNIIMGTMAFAYGVWMRLAAVEENMGVEGSMHWSGLEHRFSKRSIPDNQNRGKTNPRTRWGISSSRLCN